MKNQLLATLYQQPNTVFSLKEISLLVPEIPYNNLRRRMAHSIRTGAIGHLARGIYGKPNHNPLELANKLYTPSYVSLETVLRQAGVVFQHSERIFSISYITRTVKVGEQSFQYRQAGKKIILNRRGLVEQGVVAIASPERAFLDAVHLYKEYHFDNLGALNWDTVFALQDLYESKALEKRVKEYYHIYREER